MARIVLDCDDVLLDGALVLAQYLQNEHGIDCHQYVGKSYPSTWPEVNGMDGLRVYTAGLIHSPLFEKAPPMPGAVELVKGLKEAGHELIVVTSISDDPFARQGRTRNLESVFGKGVFSDIVFLPLVIGNKGDEIKKQKADIVIDDSLSNLEQALLQGAIAIMPELEANQAERKRGDFSPKIKQVKRLEDIPSMIAAGLAPKEEKTNTRKESRDSGRKPHR